MERGKQFNFIYDKLVSSETDFIGMIAYSLYKQDKVKYCKRIKNETGNNPTNEQLNEFHQIKNGELEAYEQRALATFSTCFAFLSDKKGHCRHNDVSFWKSVGAGIVSAFIYSLFLVGGYFIVKYAVPLETVLINVID